MTKHNLRALAPFGDLFHNAIKLFRKNPNVLSLISVIPFVIGAVLILPEKGGLAIEPTVTIVIVGMVFALMSIAVRTVHPFAFYTSLRKIENGHVTDAVSSYVEGFKHFWQLLLISLLVSILILGGISLFIVPVLFVLTYIGFTHFAFIFEGKRGLDAVVQSIWTVRGYAWDIFGYSFLMVILLIVASLIIGLVGSILAIPFGAGLGLVQILVGMLEALFITPIVFTFYYLLYSDVKAAKEHLQPTHAELERIKKIVVAFTITASLAIVGVLVIAGGLFN